MAVIEEMPPPCPELPDGKYRVIFDATVPHVNNRMRVLDQVDYPSACELEDVLRYMREKAAVAGGGLTMGFLKFDIKSAHRLIRHPRKDWKFLVVHLGDRWYTNTVETCGTSAAPYQWARAYGVVHRVLGHLADPWSWGLIYVDDGMWALPLDRLREESALILLTHRATGIPTGWKKTRVSVRKAWVGYYLILVPPTLGITPRRAAAVVAEGSSSWSRPRWTPRLTTPSLGSWGLSARWSGG